MDNYVGTADVTKTALGKPGWMVPLVIGLVPIYHFPSVILSIAMVINCNPHVNDS